MPNAATLRIWLRGLFGPSVVRSTTSTWPFASRWTSMTPTTVPLFRSCSAAAASSATSIANGFFQVAASAPGGATLRSESAIDTVRVARSASAATTAIRVTVWRSR